jgi:glycosyltransferase involved in cell wall biosynthesis
VVLSSGVPLAAEWGRHGGPVFRQGDAGELADELGRFLADERLRDTLGRRGPELAARYRWTSVAERLLAVWRRVLGDPPVG